MWWKVALFAVAVLVVAVLAAAQYGSSRWRTETQRLKAILESELVAADPAVYDSSEIEDLPLPAQRYFRKVLTDGQPVLSAVRIRQEGTFNATPGSDQWSPFSAIQHVVVDRPGFVWDARVSMFGGVPVLVRDAYAAGQGILEASVLGLLLVAEMRGTSEIAKGELMRFLAEAAWYPTALLPSQGARWEAVDDSSASVTIEDGDTRVTMLFRFNQDDLIESVYAEERGREVNGEIVPTPWEGRWDRYQSHDGMLIPTEGEVAWILPEGRSPYWRGRIIEYTCE